MAALYKVFIGLWVIKAADDGPDGGDWGVDLLDDGGAALVLSYWMDVVSSNGVRNRIG